MWLLFSLLFNVGRCELTPVAEPEVDAAALPYANLRRAVCEAGPDATKLYISPDAIDDGEGVFRIPGRLAILSDSITNLRDHENKKGVRLMVGVCVHKDCGIKGWGLTTKFIMVNNAEKLAVIPELQHNGNMLQGHVNLSGARIHGDFCGRPAFSETWCYTVSYYLGESVGAAKGPLKLSIPMGGNLEFELASFPNLGRFQILQEGTVSAIEHDLQCSAMELANAEMKAVAEQIARADIEMQRLLHSRDVVAQLLMEARGLGHSKGEKATEEDVEDDEDVEAEVAGFMEALTAVSKLAGKATADSVAHPGDAFKLSKAKGLWEAVAQLRNVPGLCLGNQSVPEVRSIDADGIDSRSLTYRSSRRSGPGNGVARGSTDFCPPWELGWTILEADNLVKGNKFALADLVQKECPSLRIEGLAEAGKQGYARVRVLLSEESAVRDCIKQIAKDKGKRTNIKTIRMFFNSPPDSPRAG